MGRKKLQCRRSSTCVYFSLLDGFSQWPDQEVSHCPAQDWWLYRSSWGLVSCVVSGPLLLLWLLHFPALGPSILQHLDLVLFLQHLSKANNPLFTNILQCLAFEQWHCMFSLHILGFQGCKKEDFVLWSDSRPHQGAFEGVSGRIKQDKISSKRELHLQQLAAIQNPAVSPQVISKTSPCCSHDNGCVSLFLYADKKQIKSEPHGTCLQSVPRGNN